MTDKSSVQLRSDLQVSALSIIAASPAGGGGGGGTSVPFAAPSALVGLIAIGGTAASAQRSDSAPAIDQGIVPAWTGLHTFNAGANIAGGTLSGTFGGGPTISGAWTFSVAPTFSSATAGRVQFAGASGILSDDNNLIWDNTNKRLGIGTALGAYNPGGAPWSATLALQNGNSGGVGPVLALRNSSGNVVGSAVEIGFYPSWNATPGPSNADAAIVATVTAGGTSIAFNSYNGSFGGRATRLFIDETGKVGIGTSAPAAKLDVSDNFVPNSTTPDTIINFTRPVNPGTRDYGSVRFDMYATGAGTTNAHEQLDLVMVDGINNVFNATPTMSWNATGKVGINNVTPQAALDIVGSALVSGSLTVPTISGATAFSGLATFNAGLAIAAGQAATFGGDVSLSRKTNGILQMGSGNKWQSSNYSQGMTGFDLEDSGRAEFDNLSARGEFRASIFTVGEKHATGGTQMVAYGAGTLYADATIF